MADWLLNGDGRSSLQPLPVIPDLYESVKKAVAVHGRPTLAGVAQKVELLVGADELCLVRFPDPVDGFHECVLIASAEVLRRDVVEQAFEVVRWRATGI